MRGTPSSHILWARFPPRPPLSASGHHSQLVRAPILLELDPPPPRLAVSFLSAVSHSWCKISSAVSFRNKYLQPFQWQETSGDFPPLLPARAGPPGKCWAGVPGRS